MTRFSRFMCLCTVPFGIANGALAEEAAPYQIDLTKGYLGCDIDMTDTIENVPLDMAMEMAEESGAPGFLYWADNKYLVMFKEPYPATCDSPPVNDWPVYLPSETIQFYQEAAFGFDGCGLDLSEPLTNLSMAGMFRMARDRAATGFVYDKASGTGRVFTGDFPQGCTPAPNPDWALYLGQN